jgi:hypothetical protein
MTVNIFKILSLIDYNNTILKENNLHKYLFDIYNLKFLFFYKKTSLSTNSIILDSNSNLDSLTNSIILDRNSNLDSLTNSIILDRNSNLDSFYESNSYPSITSVDSNISFRSEINNEKNNINLDYIENDSEQMSNSEQISNSEQLTRIIQDDYDLFFNYLTILESIKYSNIELYNKLKNRGIYINLYIIKNEFILSL